MMRAAGRKRNAILAAIFLAAFGPCTRGADGEGRPNLEQDVLPLLKARCLKCHGPLKPKGKLNLSSPRSLARGGSSGPVVVPGNLDESTLWDLVSNDEMPPKPEEPLSADEKSSAAPLDRAGGQELARAPPRSRGTAPATDHWAFAPPARPRPPSVQRPAPRPHPGRSLHPEGARGSAG